MRKGLLKFLTMVIVSVFLIGLGALSVVAADDITVTIDGAVLAFDVPPQLIDGRTMVPMRLIFEAMGAEVDWDGDTQTVTATHGDITVIMQIDNEIIIVSGVEIALDVPPMLIDGRTLVPARAVAESLGADVDWDNATRTVIIISAEDEDVDETVDEAVDTDEIVRQIRYIFEQNHMPDVLDMYSEELLLLFSEGDATLFEGLIRYEWNFVNRVLFAGYLADNHAGYSFDDLGPLLVSADALQAEHGLGDEQIISATFERIGDTGIFVIDMLETELPLIATFLAIAFNDDVGLSYFALERSMDWFNTGDVPHAFAHISVDGRQNFGAVENDRDAFIEAIMDFMTR